jgi:hypothetical protein
MPVQVAEVALRRETGETRLSAVRLVSATRSGDDTTVVMAVGETSYDVVVRRSTAPATALLTCKTVRENPVPAYDVVQVRAR